jgi:hypothetical protein
MKIEQVPENLQQYFKQIAGRWFVIILSVHYISDGFDTLLQAVHHLIEIDEQFEHSKEIQQMKNKITF